MLVTACKAGPHSSPAPESRAHGPAFEPELRTPAAVELAILGEKTNVVSHADLPGQGHVSIREVGVTVGRLLLGEDE